MKARIFIFVLAALIPFQYMQAQTSGQDMQDFAKSQTAFRPDVRLSLGSSFYSFYPGMNGFSTWVAPEISMPINKKWTFAVGIAYASFLTTGAPKTAGFGNTVQSFGSVYVKGRYQANEKLDITVVGYKTFNLSPQKPEDKVNPRAIDFSNSGAMVSVNYKVSNHFSIDAAFSMEQRHYNAFDLYGYGFPGFGGGYYGSPMGTVVPGGFYSRF